MNATATFPIPVCAPAGTPVAVSDDVIGDSDEETVRCHVCKFWFNPLDSTMCGYPDCARRHPGTD